MAFRRVKEQINREEYERYSNMAVGDFHREVEAGISDSWRWGYGWYGCYLMEEDGKYYIIHKIGDTCD